MNMDVVRPDQHVIEGTFEIDQSPWIFPCALRRSIAIKIYSSQYVNPSTKKGLESEGQQWTMAAEREKVPVMQGKINLPKITKFKLKFEVVKEFGPPGAFVVENRDKHEFFLKSATLGYVVPKQEQEFHFNCNSWVYPLEKTKVKRIFFINQVSLPSETPPGLQELRKKELDKLRGSKGERKPWDRIYEYDVYNDLGDPDRGREYSRPVLGASDRFPYPRRLRTGRPPCLQEHSAESRPAGCFEVYVPPDERLSNEKQKELINNFVDALVRFLTPKSDDPALLFEKYPDFIKRIVRKTFPQVAFSPAEFRRFQSIVDFILRKPKLAPNQDTRNLHSMDDIFNFFSEKEATKLEGRVLEKMEKLVPKHILKQVVDTAVANESKRNSVNSQIPSIIAEEQYAWIEHKEFGRQMLAGMNPVRIRFLKESEIPSGTNYPKVEEIRKAQKEDNAFILDHNYLLPYLDMINGKGVCAYATRTILVRSISWDDTIEPIAIELRLPSGQKEQVPFPSGQSQQKQELPSASGAQSQKEEEPSDQKKELALLSGQKKEELPFPNSNIHMVYHQDSDPLLWLLAKTHVAANDTAHHQLVSHWLHTHAVIEPFIIATRRQLSVMHPIHRLLDPHFKDTLHINALARAIFLNAGGILENTLFTGEFSMSLSSHFYKEWRFDEQSLPTELQKRGMAVKAEDIVSEISEKKEEMEPKKEEEGLANEDMVEKDEGPGEIDENAVELDDDVAVTENKNTDKPAKFPGGVKLVLEDYPYAKDGLEIWEAIETWVTEYCKIFYKTDNSVEDDKEIQSWWHEIRTEGHGDQKLGWYELETHENLIRALTTLIWITSGLHAAVNFGQYAYAGYPLNRPMLLRKFIPKPGTQEFQDMTLDPDNFFLQMLPEKFQMAFVIAVMDLLSRHTSDEVYLGQRPPEKELDDDKGKKVNEKFLEFREQLKQIEKNIKERNKMYSLMNRWGYAKIPYKLLYPDAPTAKPSTSKEKDGPERVDITGKGIPNSISI